MIYSLFLVHFLLCTYIVAIPQDIILLNPGFTSQSSLNNGNFFVKVIKNVPDFNSCSALIDSLFISSGEKHVELANTIEQSTQLWFKKSSLYKINFVSSILLLTMS